MGTQSSYGIEFDKMNDSDNLIGVVYLEKSGSLYLGLSHHQIKIDP